MENNIRLDDFSRPLLAWYDSCRRPLPWRLHVTPYRVWVSEIMLQQTRVEAVKPYFARFMEALPTVEALANCDSERLNKLWEGLGYYSRVRNMQRAARQIMEEHGGVIPADYEALLRLAGVGSYTAGAIASFAYGIPAAAVDGNVLRVLARVTGDTRNILDPVVKRDYETAVNAVIPHDRAGDYNQALIEVGATVCGPNGAPDCVACPLAPYCRARAEGSTDTIPYRAKKKPRRREEKTVLLVRDGEHTLVHRRPAEGLLAGLYEFPTCPGYLTEEEAIAVVRAWGLEPVRIAPLAEAKHAFTHIEWHMRGYMITVADAALPANTPLENEPRDACNTGTTPTFYPSENGTYIFADIAALTDTYAVPSAYASYLGALSLERGSRRIRREKKASPKTLTAVHLRRALPQLGEVEVHDTLPSTNTRARALAEAGAPDGTVVIARGQTAGRGRFDRAFVSPVDCGLYLSYIVRPTCPAEEIPHLTTCAAVAVAEAVETLADTTVQIKWVNDLWIDGKKICGILTEGALNTDGSARYAVIGIGLNVRHAALPVEVAEIATSIEDATGERLSLAAVAEEVLRTLGARLAHFTDKTHLAAYRARSALDGARVQVLRGNDAYDATVVGIGAEGELLLVRDDGARVSLSSGEVSVRRI